MQGLLQTYCIILSSCKQGLNGAYVFPHIYMHMIQGGKKSKYFCKILINMYQSSDFSIIMVHIVNKVNGVSNVEGLVMSLWLRSEVELLFSNIHDSAPALSLRISLGSAFNYVLNPDEDRNGELQRKAKSGRWCCFIWVHFFLCSMFRHQLTYCSVLLPLINTELQTWLLHKLCIRAQINLRVVKISAT